MYWRCWRWWGGVGLHRVGPPGPRAPEETGDGKDVRVLAHAGQRGVPLVVGEGSACTEEAPTASPRVPEETGDGRDVRVLAHAGGVLLVVGEGSACTEEAP